MTPGALYEAPAKRYRKARNLMHTRDTGEVVGEALARKEEAAGFYVVVCCYCLSPALKLALMGLANISHGCCKPCFEREAGKGAKS